MKNLDNKRIIAFVSQFDESDKEKILECINQIEIISSDEVKSFFLKMILDNISGGDKIVVFTVADHGRIDRTLKSEYHSDDVVGKMLTDIGKLLSKNNKKNILFNEEKDEIKNKFKIGKNKDCKIKIFLIDVGINSGHQIIKFFNENKIIKSIKSWESYHLCSCQFYILTYYAYECGIKYIKQHTSKFSNDGQFIYKYKKATGLFNQKTYIDLFEKYEKKYSFNCHDNDYSRIGNNIIFDFSVPNSVPLIFRSTDKKKQWISLFDGTALDPELSLSLKKQKFKTKGRQIYFKILKILNKRNGYKNISKFILLTEEELYNILDNLRKWGCIDCDNNITEFGKRMLTDRKILKNNDICYNLKVDYLPTKFGEDSIHI